jgi:hypothetical protein
MQSFRKKITTFFNVGIDPYKEGKGNFNNPIKEVEELAKERLFDCINCPKFVDEPIDFLRVKDERIKEFSNKMCDECGCTLSYKSRQSIEKCKLWKE